jgi:hypothetical protein
MSFSKGHFSVGRLTIDYGMATFMGKQEISLGGFLSFEITMYD